MSTWYLFSKDSSSCDSGAITPFPSDSQAGLEDVETVGMRNRPLNAPPPAAAASFLMRTTMRVSRARWFKFLRRVFHYQNDSRSNLGSNPFNSSTWMMLEYMALIVQLCVSTFTLAISEREKPVWPMRIWAVGYNIGCALSLLLLYGRHRGIHAAQEEVFGLSDPEQQRGTEESRYSHLMNKCRTSLELFFAIWFVMGSVWAFDSRFGSFQSAPKLHILCISLLAWNALCYSFPFLLFLLLCCFVPVISSMVGYNMYKQSVDRSASDDQISSLPIWRYAEISTNIEYGNGPDCNSSLSTEDQGCCICLAKYKEKEELRQLPCSHMFHLKCADQWLKIISCCPLCKQGLDR